MAPLLVLRTLLSVPAIAASLVLLAQTPFNVGASLRVTHQLRVSNWVPNGDPDAEQRPLGRCGRRISDRIRGRWLCGA